MPDQLPPPPPPPSSSPPPPPVYGSGHVVPATPSRTAGLRTAATVLFWCTAGATFLVAFAAVNRRSVWDGFVDGDKSILDVDDADGVIGAAGLISGLLVIASLIVVSIWALRTARNARSTGAVDVTPGLACGGWYIPFGNLVVPFVQLRRVAAHRRRPTASVSLWQGLAIASYVVSLGFQSTGNFDAADNADDVAGRLTAQTVLSLVLALLVTAMAFVAMRAMRDVDGDAAART